MIYVIKASNISKAISSGSVLVVLSSDSQQALICSANTSVDFLETYDDEDLDMLLTLPKWRQPCKDCEI